MTLRMRWSVLAAISILSFALAFSYKFVADKAQIDRHFDFGSLREGEKVSHMFSVRNIGLHSIRITGTETSCGCTVATPDEEVVPPFQSVTVPATVDLTGRAGPIRSDIWLHLEHGEPLQLTMEGFVIDDSPARVDLGRFLLGQSPTKEFKLNPVTPHQLEVVDANFDKEVIDAQFAIDEKSQGVRATVIAKPTLPYGAFSTKLVVTTNDSVEPVKSITVAGEVRDAVELSAEKVSLGSLEANEPRSAQIELHSPYGAALSIGSITTDMPDYFSARLVNQPSPDSAIVEVAVIDIPKTPRLLKGMVSVLVNCQDQEIEKTFIVYAMVPGVGTPPQTLN